MTMETRKRRLQPAVWLPPFPPQRAGAPWGRFGRRTRRARQPERARWRAATWAAAKRIEALSCPERGDVIASHRGAAHRGIEPPPNPLCLWDLYGPSLDGLQKSAYRASVDHQEEAKWRAISRTCSRAPWSS